MQLTTDGHKAYLEAIEGAFGNEIDYAMLIKIYEGDSGKRASAERRYSPRPARGRKRSGSPATRTRRTSARPTSSARI